MNHNDPAEINAQSVTTMPTGVEHEKAVVMRYISDIKRDYSGVRHKPDYLDRAPALPTFTPNLGGASRTSGMYTPLNSIYSALTPIEQGSIRSYYPGKSSQGYGGKRNVGEYQF